MMKRLLLAAPLFGGLLGVTAIHSAHAAPITYTYEAGTTFTLEDGDTATLSGTFTIDPSNNSLISPDIVITGSGSSAGTYAPEENDVGETLVYDRAVPATGDFQILEVFFDRHFNTPGTTANPLNEVVWNNIVGDFAFSLETSGGIIPPTTGVPEPSSMAILGGTLLCLTGLGRRSRKSIITTRARHDNQGRTGMMKRLLLVVPVFGGLLGVTAIHAAHAAPITYTYEAGTAFTLEDGETGILSGSFTIDPPGDSLTSPNVVIIGTGLEAGTYRPAENDNGVTVIYDRLIGSDFQEVELFFDNNLNTAGTTANRLDHVAWIDTDGGNDSFSSAVSGGIIPPTAAVPEPSSLVILGGVLGLAGLARLSSRRAKIWNRSATAAI